MVWWWCFWRCSVCRPRNAVIVANQNPKESLKAKVQAGKRMCWTTSEVTQMLMLWFREWWDLIAFLLHMMETSDWLIAFWPIGWICFRWRSTSSEHLNPQNGKMCTVWLWEPLKRCQILIHLILGSELIITIRLIWHCLKNGKDWMKTGVFVGLRGTSMAWSHRRGGEMECDRRYIEAELRSFLLLKIESLFGQNSLVFAISFSANTQFYLQFTICVSIDFLLKSLLSHVPLSASGFGYSGWSEVLPWQPTKPVVLADC